jgi:hypothetical protein
MYERFIFASEIERSGTRQMLSESFPLAKIWNVHDELETDFLMDMEAPCSQETFFRYVVQTPGPARLLIYSCYNLSLLLHEPPLWMIQELRRLSFQLPSGEIK